MRKHIIAVFVAVITCLAALSGCSLVRGLEKDLQVVFEVNGEYYGCGTVNIFNNTVVKEPDAQLGYYFRGWTNVPEWTEEEASTVPVIENTGLVRYDDVKDMVKAGSESVTLYGVFAEIARHDLKIAWYGKEGTSGLNQDYMDAFETRLYAYLASEGYTPDSMDIVIQNYGTGDVGTTCGAIMKDADVDIMVGWSSTSNLTGTGGMPAASILDNVGKITIGSTARYAARLSDTELCNLVYIWIQNEYGPEPVVTYSVTFNSNGGSEVAVKTVESGKTVSKPTNPVLENHIFDGWYTDDGTFNNEYDFSTPVTGDLTLYAKWTEGTPEILYTVVIGWWNYKTSGLTSEIMTNVNKGLETYLEANDYDVKTVEIIIRNYDDSGVANVGTAVLGDNDVDIMLGMAANFATTGKVSDYVERVSDIPMGTETNGRYIYLLTNGDLAKFVYDWLQTDGGKALLLTTEG